MKNGNLFTDPFTGNSATYYNLGQQSTVRELMQVLFTTRFIELFRTMQDEALVEDLATNEKLGDN